jgi:4-diphosphocytidyl-2C-methyl-D-erythritol kinase
MRNDLESVVCRLRPEVEAARSAVAAVGGVRSGVTGSGAAAFVLMCDPATAKQASRDLLRPGWRVITTRTLTRDEARLMVQPMTWEDAT